MSSPRGERGGGGGEEGVCKNDDHFLSRALGRGVKSNFYHIVKNIISLFFLICGKILAIILVKTIKPLVNFKKWGN